MFDVVFSGLTFALAALGALECTRKRANALAAGQGWLYTAAFVVLGLALAYLLPKPYLRPLRSLAMAVFVFTYGYSLAFRRYSDPNERNSRYIGWFFIVFSLALALSAFV